MEGEIIESRTIGAHQVGEYRANLKLILIFQQYNQLGNILRFKTKAVHTAVNFNMYRVVGQCQFFGSCHKELQQSKTVDFRLQLIIENCAESSLFGVHHYDGHTNSLAPQLSPFIAYSHSQVITAIVLQRARHFHRSAAISKSLHHTHGFGFGTKFGAEIVQVVHQRIQIHIQCGFVHNQFQPRQNIFEMKTP